MTTIRQIEANRRNALKSTGPMTAAGKQRSRRNAVRHGLTAETVIADLEDAEDYKAFELAVTSDFDAPTAVERELVLRLTSLLWRLRRATAIQTGLLQLQHDIIAALKKPRNDDSAANKPGADSIDDHDRGLKMQTQSFSIRCCCLSSVTGAEPNQVDELSNDDNSNLARRFLRLANVDNGVFERASRYETALWRQVGQVLLTLGFLRRNR
jgi:hypothetical protein